MALLCKAQREKSHSPICIRIVWLLVTQLDYKYLKDCNRILLSVISNISSTGSGTLGRINIFWMSEWINVEITFHAVWFGDSLLMRKKNIMSLGNRPERSRFRWAEFVRRIPSPVETMTLWPLKKALVDTKFSVIIEHYSKCRIWFNSLSSGEGNYGHIYVL